MKIYTSNLVNDDTAYATVQLTAAELKALRHTMHTPDQFNSVKFQHGVYLNYRSNGWYRLEATNTFRAIEKIRLALRVIEKFAHGGFSTSVAHAHTPTEQPVPKTPVRPPVTPIGDEQEPVEPLKHSPRPQQLAALLTHFARA